MERDYWAIKRGDHAQLPYRLRIVAYGLSSSVSISLYKYPVLLKEACNVSIWLLIPCQAGRIGVNAIDRIKKGNVGQPEVDPIISEPMFVHLVSCRQHKAKSMKLQYLSAKLLTY